MIEYKYILLYSGGKTGSSTLYESLKRYIRSHGLSTTLYYGHTFENPHSVYNHPSFPFQEKRRTGHVYRNLLPGDKQGKSIVMTSFRETIGRHVSSFFHHFLKHMSPIIAEKQVTWSSLTLPQQFELVKVQMTRELSGPTRWESYHPLPMDMFTFDHEKKLGFHHREHFGGYTDVDVLCLRFDTISQWQHLLQPYFPSIRIISENITSNKKYGTLYRYFKEHYEYPPSTLETVWNKDRSMSSIFYTKEEERTILQHYHLEQPHSRK